MRDLYLGGEQSRDMKEDDGDRQLKEKEQKWRVRC